MTRHYLDPVRDRYPRGQVEVVHVTNHHAGVCPAKKPKGQKPPRCRYFRKGWYYVFIDLRGAWDGDLTGPYRSEEDATLAAREYLQ